MAKSEKEKSAQCVSKNSTKDSQFHMSANSVINSFNLRTSEAPVFFPQFNTSTVCCNILYESVRISEYFGKTK